MFVPTGFPFPSAAAKELGEKLMDTIRQYRQTNPDLTTFEIRGALRIAQRGAGTSPMERVLSLAVVMVALLIGVVLLVLRSDRSASGGSTTVVASLAVATVVMVLVIMMIARRQ